jgi:hypothetical protein
VTQSCRFQGRGPNISEGCKASVRNRQRRPSLYKPSFASALVATTRDAAGYSSSPDPHQSARRKGGMLNGGLASVNGVSLEAGNEPGARRTRGRIRSVDRIESNGPSSTRAYQAGRAARPRHLHAPLVRAYSPGRCLPLAAYVLSRDQRGARSGSQPRPGLCPVFVTSDPSARTGCGRARRPSAFRPASASG